MELKGVGEWNLGVGRIEADEATLRAEHFIVAELMKGCNDVRGPASTSQVFFF